MRAQPTLLVDAKDRSEKRLLVLPVAATLGMSLAFGSWAWAWRIESRTSHVLMGATGRVEGFTDLRRDTRKTYVSLLESLSAPGHPLPRSFDASLTQLEVQARALAKREPEDGQLLGLVRLIDEWSAAARTVDSARGDFIGFLRPRLDAVDQVIADVLAKSEAEIRGVKNQQRFHSVLQTLAWASCCLALGFGAAWRLAHTRVVNRKLEAMSRAKSDLLANMSHELRTPLNAIIGFAELIHDQAAGPVSDQQRDFLGDILNSGRHLLALINDILDLAKVEAGKMEFNPQPIELGPIIGEVTGTLGPAAAAKHIAIRASVDGEVARVIADPIRLKQVLYNYLSNAVKFTPEGGRVEVRARPEGADGYRIEVADTGIGIQPEDLKRLFQTFHQLDPTLTKKNGGTGLGLALTRKLVEAQGGEVGVRSEWGTGSVFHAIFPRGCPPNGSATRRT